MPTKRKSTEEGHRRKFLVVVDDTPECTRALLFAGRRALSTPAARLVLLYVIVPSEFTQWVGVENIMRAEAMEEAEAALGKAADIVRDKTDDRAAAGDPRGAARGGDPRS